jgi:hypothetical protein
VRLSAIRQPHGSVRCARVLGHDQAGCGCPQDWHWVAKQRTLETETDGRSW